MEIEKTFWAVATGAPAFFSGMFQKIDVIHFAFELTTSPLSILYGIIWPKSMKSKLQMIRLLQGLTQKDIAKLSGIDQGDISRLENNKRHPSKREKKGIAAALKMKEEELFPDLAQNEDEK
jgi:DNA-binding XRE family transcriptional regulator